METGWFIKTHMEEQEDELCSMLRRMLNVYKSTTVIVEALSNASGSRSEGSSPSGILQKVSAIKVQTKTIR